MRSPLKILYVASEVAPFAKTGGLADVAAAFPKALQELGHDIRVMMPKYGVINERRYVLREVIRLKEVIVDLGGEKLVGSVKSAFIPDTKVQVYFLDYPPLFGRPDLYTDPKTGKDWPDNAERFTFFCKGVLETLKLLHWQPHVIHCNDWHTGLIPVLLRTTYSQERLFAKTSTVFSIHNLAYQGVFSKTKFALTGLPQELFRPDGGVEFYGKLSFLKAGIVFADALTTVSERYAEEITSDPELACGLMDELRSRREALFGILNGIDDSVWNPKTDPLIAKNYSLTDLAGKAENKRALLENLGLPYMPEVPVLGMISRLADQKGFDLVAEAFPELMKHDLQFVLLGTGEPRYHKLFASMAKRYPKKVSVNLRFDNALAHQIEAGADMFLMPSRYEPCGLNQMYSLVYGTIPIVRATGGLADTITEFDPERCTGNGFVFVEYNAQALLQAVERALGVWADQKVWRKLVKSAMRSNFSWKNSASKYVKLYTKLEMSRRK
ncbi:MAG: glycogen synthase GlgA [candidate division KSB1 bacterium]|nr:glycogen synthase GlgA [candidate division KSB1 bacterium]